MVNKFNILVTGSSGQLGNELKKISSEFNEYKFIFMGKNKLDISNSQLIENTIQKNKIDIIINCAAYTDVKKAEENRELANLVNNLSVDNLAKICFKEDIKLIHISTDYVFDGIKKCEYTEADIPNPINFYGLSKLNGEISMLKYDLKQSIIIRTSWLYSELDNNFVSKIYSKIKSKNNINVIENEFGSPTNAKDLALAILQIIPKLKNIETEIYHYSNMGICSRLDLANAVNLIVNGKSNIISTNILESKLKRPKFSALNNSKFKNKFDIEIKNWKESLNDHFNELGIAKYIVNEI